MTDRAEIETMIREAEEARIAHDRWMTDWRQRHGHTERFDPSTGIPLTEITPWTI